MFINTLKIHNFRNIKYKEFLFNKRVNVFHGANGVGKTSILEAIYFLSTAKSFRKSSSKSIINFDEKQVTVFSKINTTPSNTFAISKNISGKWSGKINNKSISKQSQLTPLLQVVAIDPEVYRLIDFGPQHRRSFLDWFVFHVEHEYITIWKKAHKCIRQLNLLYKRKSSNNEILAWEKSFIEFSELLNTKREKYFSILKPRILSYVQTIQPDIKALNISYKKGWSDQVSLTEQLSIDRSRNLKFGQLQHGPHKMDLKITINNFPASQILSRGQKKLLSIMFYLSYITTMIKDFDLEPIICLDDLDAEIDLEKLKQITNVFNDLGVQIFISTVDEKKLISYFDDMEMFHVEHI